MLLPFFFRHKSIEALKLLLKRGADPNKPDNDECTPLLFASRRGYTEIADILLSDERIKVNYANLAKITPLLAACAGGSKPVCEMLLAHNADITTKSSNLTTAVHYAAFSGHAEICELLITTGMEVSHCKYSVCVAGATFSVNHWFNQNYFMICGRFPFKTRCVCL